MKRDREEGGNSAIEDKIWDGDQADAGMDELLAVLGYRVRSSDMPDVAHKLEQLEIMMGTTMEDGISHLSSDTVHYNPSDLSGWLQSMLSEFHNASPSTNSDVVQGRTSPGGDCDNCNLFASRDPHHHQQQQQNRIYDDNSEYDLRAIPGGAIYRKDSAQLETQSSHSGGTKRAKSLGSEFAGGGAAAEVGVAPAGMTTAVTESSRAMVLVDSQETGIRLVHTLMACAEAVQRNNLKVADTLVKHIGVLAVSQTGAMRKVATYFAEALARRIYKIYPQDVLDSSYSDILQMHFYEACPYLKFAHFTANQAILEAFGGASRVHVIDFSLKQGMQWPALMQALALRPGGPPAFRLTGIGPPQPDDTDALQQVGWKLAQLAETMGVEFEFRGFVTNSLADLDAAMLEIRPTDVEAVAVNSVFDLHRLLGRPGAIDKVLNSIKAMKPKIVTIVEQEANHNGTVFLDRFNEALYYYSTMFDSLDTSGLTQGNAQDVEMSEVYLGRQICNVVACEGPDRVERHETLGQWRARMESSGFAPVHLGSNAFAQASMLLAVFAGREGYRVEENDGCLMLGWHTRPLIATSAWQLAVGAESN